VSRTRGFLLIEVVVAVLMVTVGLIALAATAGAVARMAGQGQRRGGAGIAAASRLEVLRSGGCASLAGGRDSAGAYLLQWTVTTQGAVRTIQLAVGYPDGRDVRSDRFEAVEWCP